MRKSDKYSDEVRDRAVRVVLEQSPWSSAHHLITDTRQPAADLGSRAPLLTPTIFESGAKTDSVKT